MSRYSPGKKSCVKFIVMVFFELLDFDYYIIVVFVVVARRTVRERVGMQVQTSLKLAVIFFSDVQCRRLVNNYELVVTQFLILTYLYPVQYTVYNVPHVNDTMEEPSLQIIIID